MEQRLNIAEQIAERIHAHFGYRYTKCLDMAMHGSWWKLDDKDLANLSVEKAAEEVIKDIETGVID